MNDFGESIIVEAYFSGARVIGLLKNASQNRRLVDLLNNQDLTFELNSAEMRLSSEATRCRYDSLLLSKTDLLYAIPRESADQVRRRAMNRTGISLGASQKTALGFMFESLTITGTATLPPAMNPSRLEAAMFSRFFALTDVTIGHPDGSSSEEQVVIVNRDRILALGRRAAA